MKFVKIVNLLDMFGRADYKGLDIEKFIAGSQVYKIDYTECVLATNEENIPVHDDLTEITEQEYIDLRNTYLGEQNQQTITLEEKINLIQQALDELILNGGA